MALRLLAVALTLCAGTAQACEVVDFLKVPLKAGNPIKVALETAYPGLKVEEGAVVFGEDAKLPLGDIRDIDEGERLKTATIAEQFLYRYPLAFDLSARKIPWVDPGRLRNDAFFKTLYSGRKSEVYSSLEIMRYPGLRIKSKFAATTKHCVHVQLRAALAAAARIGNLDRYFDKAGGSFNWRQIAGTRRLSAHSFGIAVDINTSLGGYWRWSGAREGAVEQYRNRIPAELVQTFERHGFIWGGKWHHYDGMHFEYRPELILFSRLTGG